MKSGKVTVRLVCEHMLVLSLTASRLLLSGCSPLHMKNWGSARPPLTASLSVARPAGCRALFFIAVFCCCVDVLSWHERVWTVWNLDSIINVTDESHWVESELGHAFSTMKNFLNWLCWHTPVITKLRRLRLCSATLSRKNKDTCTQKIPGAEKLCKIGFL